MPRPSVAEKRRTFRKMHESGCWMIPNPWDVGSARYLQGLGFKALASTSSGFAWSEGYADTAVGVDMVLGHLKEIVAATDVPVNADFEGGYADDPAGVAKNVARCCETGVAGLSIEDSTGNKDKPLYDIPFAVERMKAARAAIDKAGGEVFLTGRAEGFIAGVPDLEQMIERLKAYSAAGADCLYAPGINTREQIEAIVQSGRAEAGEFPQRRGVRSFGERSRQHGRAAHQCRRRARALRLGRLHAHGEGDRRAGHVRGLQGCGERRRAERLLHQGHGGARVMNSQPDPLSGLPVGLPVDTTPAQKPAPVVFEGRYGGVEKLDAARHGAALWDAVRGEQNNGMWAYMNYGPFAGESEFATWLAERPKLEIRIPMR